MENLQKRSATPGAKIVDESVFRERTYPCGHLVDLRTGPMPDQIDILDIAHHLSHINRYNGAVHHFYSVAEHCLYVSMLAHPKDRAYFLLHDVAEYLYMDIIKPVKYVLGLDDGKERNDIYHKLCVQCEKQVLAKLGLNYNYFHSLYDQIKEADGIVYQLEKRFINARGNQLPKEHTLAGVPFGMEPHVAENEFLQAFEQYMA